MFNECQCSDDKGKRGHLGSAGHAVYVGYWEKCFRLFYLPEYSESNCSLGREVDHLEVCHFKSALWVWFHSTKSIEFVFLLLFFLME